MKYSLNTYWTGCLAIFYLLPWLFEMLLCIHLSIRNLFKNISDGFYTACIFPVVFGLLGYTIFWIAFFSLDTAKIIVKAIWGLFFLQGIYQIFKDSKQSVNQIQMVLPLICVAIFLLTIGFFPFDYSDWQLAGANRWLNLPVDNWIPKIFYDQLIHGKISDPMFGDWQPSDRPPLATGMFAIYSTFSRSEIAYQVDSVFFQSLVILPVIYLYQQHIKDGLSLFFTLITLLFSSVMLIHGVFVWPKLLAAAFVFIFFIVLFANGEVSLSIPQKALLLSSSSSFAMLSHGGSIFPLLILSFGLITFLKRKNDRALSIFAGVIVLLYSPWLVFQNYLFPPGNRLIKWHIAGMADINSLSSLEAVKTAYSIFTVREWIHGNVDDLNRIFLSAVDFWKDLYFLNKSSLIARSFFDTGYSMWLLSPLLLPVWMAVLFIKNKIHKTSRSFPVMYLSLCCGIYVVWSILMFIPGSTVIHLGSLFSWILLYFLCALAIYQIDKLIYSIICLGQILIGIYMYIPLNRDLPPFDIWMYGLIIISSLVVLAMALSKPVFRILEDPLNPAVI